MHHQEQWQSLPTWGSSEISPANSSQGSAPPLVLKFLFTSLWQDGLAGKDVCHTSLVVKSSSHRWKSRTNSIQLFSNFLRISVLVSHIAQDHEWAHLSRRCSHLGGGKAAVAHFCTHCQHVLKTLGDFVIPLSLTLGKERLYHLHGLRHQAADMAVPMSTMCPLRAFSHSLNKIKN